MPNKKLSATRALKRHDSGTMYQVGIADQCEIPLNRQNMMKQVAKRRKRLTTRPEAKLCFAFQVMKWGVGDVIHYQREKTIHLADMLSRSLDFYFNTTKLAVEADGTSHDGELARAKDDWTDRLMKEAGISMLRFRNEFIMESVHLVVRDVATHLRDNHNWPLKIRQNFDWVISFTEKDTYWKIFCGKFVEARRNHRHPEE